MKEQIKQIRQVAEEAIAAAQSEQEIEALRIRFLGKKGELTAILKQMGSLSPEERPKMGALVNEAKQELEELITAKKEELKIKAQEEKLKQETIDITMPAKEITPGKLHPLNTVLDDMINIFQSMGFDVVDGPEVETDHYNFECLNVPADHPARDMQDTYYLSSNQLLKTHTSAAQNAILIKYKKELENNRPIRVIFPGRCFRNEKIDACHENTFFQMEGIMVDKDISISNLIYFMKTMLSEVFNRDITVRLRPGFFPFVEPGFELDIQCLICGGDGCPSCKGSGWLELCPCGMIHPNVLSMGGIDPEEYTGFAFGLGLTRLAMMRYGIKDIRVFNSCNLKSLSQFTNRTFIDDEKEGK